jgi:cysteine-S-conjugate beta-lyase
MILGVRACLSLSGITSRTRQTHRTTEPCPHPGGRRDRRGVLGLLAQPGDQVVINPPGYDWFVPWLAEVGRRPLAVPLAATGDGRGAGPGRHAAASQDRARMHLLCSLHNPTGTVHRRHDLERLAARYGVVVLAEEIHAPLVLPGRTHHPLVSVSPEAAGHGIVVTSASKAWNLAGLKAR